MNNDLEQYAKNSFTDSELEFMAHGNNPVANAHRELLAFRRAAKQATPAKPSPKKPNHAQCCAEAGGDPRYCDCVNKDHVYLSTLDTTPQPDHTEQDGWKLVPIEPTQEMVDAHISGMQSAGFSRAYRDMLAAAPKPESE